jgi:hypothetical protein
MKNGCVSLLSPLSPVKSGKVIAAIFAVIVGAALPSAFAQEKSDDELVKELANPISSLISVPFQNNFEFNLGPNNDGFKYTLNFQPVIPFSLTKDWNVIIRTIVPIIDQSDVIAPNTSQGGLSDTTQSFFFSPKKPVAGMIVGAGPVFLYPSATDDLLGSEKWGAGPTIVLLKQEGPWTVGLLFNHIWSFAGDDYRNYVSSTFLQPFIAYATKTKTTFTLNTESTYDWHNEQWTVPINLLVSQLIKIGKQPVQLGLGAKVYAEGPSGALEWGVRFVVTPPFPTGGKPTPSQQPASYSK